MEETQKLCAAISNVQCRTQVVDISDRHAVYAAAAETNTRAAPSYISILVNNAGIVAGKDFLSTPDERIIKTFEVNSLVGHLLAFGPILKLGDTYLKVT